MTTHDVPPRQPGPLPPIVLVVEDDPDSRELYRTVLTMEGFWVADAADADSAAEQAADLQPDLIVTDLGLPGRSDGLALARQLHRDPKMHTVPLLAITGRPPSEVPADLFEEVLQKPVLPDALMAAVRRALTKSRELRTRADIARERVPELLERSEALLRTSKHLILRGPGRRPK